MKRRSARPFTVEIKHTRTSRASLTDATARSRKGQDLWRDLPVAAPDKPAAVQPALVAHSEPVRAEAPARRVLPSLVPIFSLSDEPEASEVREVPSVEPLPQVRRPKEVVKRKLRPAAKAAAARPAAEPTLQPQATPAIPASSMATAPAVVSQAALLQPRPVRRAPQALTLRPGERWKRRLPRVLW